MLDYRMITFLKVCQTMNYTHAAQSLHITQPAVSQHIHYLEEQLHVKLFEYEEKQLKLTEAGKILYRFAATVNHDFHELSNQLSNENNRLHLRFGVTLTIGEYLMPKVLIKLLNQHQNIHHDFHELSNQLSNENNRLHLRFGVTLTIGEYLMPKVLIKLLNQHQNIQLQMIVANTAELLMQMEEEKLDFAIVEGYYPNQEYEGRVYRKERFIGICHVDHPFAATECTLSDLKNERLLLRENGSGTREVLERALKEKNMSFDNFCERIEIGNLNVIKQLVMKKIGITFCYEPVVAQELKNDDLKVMNIKDFQVAHDFTFIWRKNSIFQNLYQSIYEQMCSCINE